MIYQFPMSLFTTTYPNWGKLQNEISAQFLVNQMTRADENFLTIFFSETLDNTQLTTVSNIIAAHNNTPIPQYNQYVIDTYDNTGGQSLNGTMTVRLDGTRVNTGQFTLNLSGNLTNSITVQVAGLYRIVYRVTQRTTTTNTASSNWVRLTTFLERDTTNTGNSFTEVDGSRGKIDCASGSFTDRGNTVTIEVILDVTENTAFRIRGTSTATSPTTLPDGSSLTIIKII